MKLQIPIIACLLAALPAAALADQNDHTYSSRASAPATRSSAQSSRSSYQQAPRYSQQRYNAQPQQRYNAQPQQRYNAQPQQRYTQPMPRYQARSYTDSRGYAQHDFVVARRDVNPWYWNRGIAWAPSPAYWGGGFWGAFGINLAFNEPAPANYDYQVAPSSPGSQLLANYGLTQTDCNQPNLVDIIGPDGSEICAYPNDEVGPGQYNVDPSTLSLISA
ncbi:MAG: hypothetical protein WBD74_02175 [Candidatus Aquilonibacter sp.]